MKNGISLTPISCPKIEAAPTEREISAPSGRKLTPPIARSGQPQAKRADTAANKNRTTNPVWLLAIGIGD